jgi:hypothetical protein
MTAAGLAVAIPAVLAYNVFGRLMAACEADLEGFRARPARDACSPPAQVPVSPRLTWPSAAWNAPGRPAR